MTELKRQSAKTIYGNAFQKKKVKTEKDYASQQEFAVINSS